MVDEENRRVDHPERLARVGAGAPDEPLDAVARRHPLECRQDPAELAVAPLEVGGQPIVARRKAGDLVVARHADRGAEVAGGDPINRRRDRPERAGERRQEEVGEEDDEQRRDDDDEEQQAPQRVAADHREDQPAEDGQRDDRRRDERQRQPRPERQGDAEAASAAVLAVVERLGVGSCGRGLVGRWQWRRFGGRAPGGGGPIRRGRVEGPRDGLFRHRPCRRRGDSRRRGRSSGGPAGSGRPRPSGGAAASSPTGTTGRRRRCPPSRGRAASRS